jgi:sensor histidine kinase YesM
VDYLAKLSSMMRYSLSEISTDKVPLENEILYLKNYIELQKIRFTEKTIVNFTLNGNVDSQLISPLLFINLIENAFKYGVSNEVETEINIHIQIKENLLKFQVKNDIINQNNRTISQKIGLKNVKRRLDLIYENNYMLKVNHSDKEFEVIVEINLV